MGIKGKQKVGWQWGWYLCMRLQFKILKMEYINNFKNLVLAETGELQQCRLSITQQQLDQFWSSKTLTEMSQILTINNDYIVNFIVSQLLPHYLTTKKLQYEAFIVCRAGERGEEMPVLYCYDCRIFRNAIYSLDENQFVSSFMLCYRENAPLPQSLYQVVDAETIEANRWVLRVKESAILKIYTSIREYFQRLPHSNDRIVLPVERYYHFIQEWMKCYYNYNLEITVNNFFKGLMALCQNQILLQYLETLTPAQREERMYGRPIKLIQRPRNVEQFTLTEQHFGQIRWQTLKIAAFRLKYRVEEDENNYTCYRIRQEPEGGYEYDQLPQEDQCILYAFENLRKNQREYTDQYSQ